ncbi:MAG: hypothetical protein KDJ76_00045 [Xanthobacteraceae bacterium]|nr:hypothetical protein [Xanthobacteraceae bacterium]
MAVQIRTVAPPLFYARLYELDAIAMAWPAHELFELSKAKKTAKSNGRR